LTGRYICYFPQHWHLQTPQASRNRLHKNRDFFSKTDIGDGGVWGKQLGGRWKALTIALSQQML
jgi:hypothetical protein